MVKVILIVCVLIMGCKPTDCLKNRNIYQRLQKLFKADEKLLASSSREDVVAYESDKRLRDTIFSKTCDAGKDPQKILFLRKINVMNGTQTGLLYLRDDSDDRLFHFYKSKNYPVVVGEGANNYEDIARIFSIIKSDVYKKSIDLKEYFEKKTLSDVPLLQIAFVDISEAGNPEGIVKFNFGLLNSEFDEVFKEKNRDNNY